MIMQVLSQGPSLLLAVWTGLALLEGGESGGRLVRISGDSSIGSTSHLSLTCYASFAVDRYLWYHNWTKIRTSNSRSTSNSYMKSSAQLQLTDSGSYYCSACNWAGCRSSSTRTVRVTAPSSASISGSSTVGYNQTLRLTCSVSGIASSYRWYRNYIRLELPGTSSHYLKSVQSRDSGSYRCKACNWAGCSSYSNSRTITVIVPPSSVWISGSSQVRYTSTLTLTCYASGIVDNYKWYHNSSILTTTTKRYSQSSAQLSDSGSYQCEACNLGGCSPRSSSYTVKVTEPPYSVSISGRSKLISPTSLSLTCYASGTVERYEWYHNGGRLPNTTSYYGKSPPQRGDSGSYQCKACNWVACTSSSSYTVTVTDPPVATAVLNPQVHSCSSRRSGSTYSALSGTSHRFDCQSAGSPPLSSYWSISTLSTNVNKTATFSTMLSHNDEGMYVCTVRNTAESDLEDTEEVTVKVYDTPVLNISESSVKVKRGDRLALQCSFTKHTNDPNSFPTITWAAPSDRPSRVSLTRQGLTLNSTYTRNSARKKDRGVYTCSVNNNCPAVGALTDAVTVTIYYVPNAVDVSSIEVTNTTFDTISIQWTPPNDNSDSIIEYRVYLYRSGGSVVFNSSQPMVTLESLQPFTTYQIRISARNNAGWGGKSGLRNVNTLTRDEVLASNVTYSTPRVGVSSYTVELRWVVPEECLTDKLEGYRLSRWPTNTTNIETTTVNRDNVSCAWNVIAIGSETYCHDWEGFSPRSQYTVSLEIIYNYGILSTGGPTNVTITIPTLPPSQEDVGTVDLALGVVMGMLLAVLVIVVAVLVVLLICKKCRRRKTKDSDTAAVYNVNKDVSGNPMEAVQFESAYGGNDYTLTDDPRYVNEDLKMSRDPHCVSDDRVTSQEQNYSSLDVKSVQTSAYASLAFYQNSSTAISKYGDNTNTTNEYYEFPEKVVPQKKPSTQQTHEYANWNVISQQHGEGDQSSVDRKSANKIPSTSGPGVKEVGKEGTAPRKSQVFASDVTMPTKKENINDTHHMTLPEKHEQRGKVPPPTKPRPDTNKKQSTLPPTQESATTKPQTCPQQPNPVMTVSPLDAPPIPPKTKKRPRKAIPEQSVDTEQPPPGPNVTELRKIIEKKYSVN